MYFASKKVFKPSQQPQQIPQQIPQNLPDIQPLNSNQPFNFNQPFIPAPPINNTKANTNILSIDLGVLSKEAHLFTGDPLVCRGCEGIFNALSKLGKDNNGKKNWICEFCDFDNEVEIEDEEIPKDNETFDYMLLPAKENTSASSREKLIIFVVDISGSMCVTTPIPGTLKLRGSSATSNNIALVANDNPQQWLPGQSRNETYVSRLQCVQAAISSQIDSLASNFPRTRIGLVVFSNDVTILGDGKKKGEIITGDKLMNYEELLNIGARFMGSENSGIGCISETRKVLEKEVFDLIEGGSTALGPAVSIAVGMAQNSPGATIVIATDGLANTGVGALDTPENSAPSVVFYNQISELSKEKGITINLIGIRGGDEMNMNVIGKLAHATMGEIDIVNPEKITENFGTILQSQLVATDVTVKLFLHKGFNPPNEDEWKKTETDKSYAVRVIGNAYSDTEITAEFNPKSEEELGKIFVNDAKKELPFQVQIEYTALSGMKCIRVITRSKEITDNQAEATSDVDISLIGMHANTKTAKLAQMGDVFGAIAQNNSYASIMNRGARSEEDKQKLYNWNSSNTKLFESPQIQQQAQQQQQFYSPQPFISPNVQPQPQPQPQLQPQTQQETSWFNSLSNFASNIKMPEIFSNEPKPQQPQQPQIQNSSFSFTSKPTNTNAKPTNTNAQILPTKSINSSIQPSGFSFGTTAPQPQIQTNSLKPPTQQQSFSFGTTAPQPQNQQQPVFSFASNVPQQQPSFSFGSTLPQQNQQPPTGFTFGSTVSPQQLNAPSLETQMMASPSYNDEVSNQLYQHQNARVQKRIWSGTRKY